MLSMWLLIILVFMSRLAFLLSNTSFSWLQASIANAFLLLTSSSASCRLPRYLHFFHFFIFPFDFMFLCLDLISYTGRYLLFTLLGTIAFNSSFLVFVRCCSVCVIPGWCQGRAIAPHRDMLPSSESKKLFFGDFCHL